MVAELVGVGVCVGAADAVEEGLGVALGVPDAVGVMVKVGDEVGVGLGGGVPVDVGVAARVGVPDGVALTVCVGDGMREGVKVGVAVPEGLEVCTTANVGVVLGDGVGVAMASNTTSAERSAADTAPSPFTSTSAVGQWLPSKMASTSAGRSSAFSVPSQLASPGTGAADAAGIAAQQTTSATARRRPLKPRHACFEKHILSGVEGLSMGASPLLGIPGYARAASAPLITRLTHRVDQPSQARHSRAPYTLLCSCLD
jgi:hypothetical protein